MTGSGGWGREFALREFANSAVIPNTNLLQQVSVYQTVNSFTGGSAREFVLPRILRLEPSHPKPPNEFGV